MLKIHGIDVPSRANLAAPGSLGLASGVPQAQAININGSLAGDAIADRYRAAGHAVQTEVPRQNGTWRVDVTVNGKAPDARNNRRIEIESKVGRASQSPELAAQALKDGEALAQNGALRATGKASRQPVR